MLRGRPNVRKVIRDQILEKLSSSEVPMTTSNITKELSKTLKKEVSWNTVQKYIQELIESGRLTAIRLPHSKKENKDGLTVYTLKK